MIQIDMDMPKSCFECDKTYKWKKDGKVQCPHINMPSISSNTTNRPSYCPLKEVPTGHWIFDKERLGYWISTCSECGHIFHGNEELIYKPKFCANCGAKMESEDK